jgi:hypothetical protein
MFDILAGIPSLIYPILKFLPLLRHWYIVIETG